jgi:hypothetical protein
MKRRGRTVEEVLNAPVNKPAEWTDEQKAIKLVGDHILQTRADVEELEDGDVYLVYFSRHMNYWAAWIGTTFDDGRLYHVFKRTEGTLGLSVFKEVEHVATFESSVL